MTFQDIFSSSFLEKVTAFSATDMIIALALAFAIIPLVEVVKCFQRLYAKNKKNKIK